MLRHRSAMSVASHSSGVGAGESASSTGEDEEGDGDRSKVGEGVARRALSSLLLLSFDFLPLQARERTPLRDEGPTAVAPADDVDACEIVLGRLYAGAGDGKWTWPSNALSPWTSAWTLLPPGKRESSLRTLRCARRLSIVFVGERSLSCLRVSVDRACTSSMGIPMGPSARRESSASRLALSSIVLALVNVAKRSRADMVASATPD